MIKLNPELFDEQMERLIKGFGINHRDNVERKCFIYNELNFAKFNDEQLKDAVNHIMRTEKNLYKDFPNPGTFAEHASAEKAEKESRNEIGYYRNKPKDNWITYDILKPCKDYNNDYHLYSGRSKDASFLRPNDYLIEKFDNIFSIFKKEYEGHYYQIYIEEIRIIQHNRWKAIFETKDEVHKIPIYDFFKDFLFFLKKFEGLEELNELMIFMYNNN